MAAPRWTGWMIENFRVAPKCSSTDAALSAGMPSDDILNHRVRWFRSHGGGMPRPWEPNSQQAPGQSVAHAFAPVPPARERSTADSTASDGATFRRSEAPRTPSIRAIPTAVSARHVAAAPPGSTARASRGARAAVCGRPAPPRVGRRAFPRRWRRRCQRRCSCR